MSDSFAALQPLTLGYVRLTDAAPLIMAAELGLYQRHGLDVTLVQERSWASLRDKLTVGLVDAAQLLAPLALYVTAGVGSPATPLLTGLALGRNGNAIAVSKALAAELDLAEPWRQPLAAAQGKCARVVLLDQGLGNGPRHALLPAERRAVYPLGQVHRHEPQRHGDGHHDEREGDQAQHQQAGDHGGRFHQQPAALHVGVVAVVVSRGIVQGPEAGNSAKQLR